MRNITRNMVILDGSWLFVCRSTRPLSRTIQPLLRNTGTVYPAREANAFRNALERRLRNVNDIAIADVKGLRPLAD